MFKSNRLNQLLKIIGVWVVYFLVFTNGTFFYPEDKILIISVTSFYILITMFSLWRIKHPSKKFRAEEAQGLK